MPKNFTLQLFFILILSVFKCVCTGPCQEDWVFYKDSCYFQSSVKKNWQIAEKNCVEKGSHLVVVNDLVFLSSFVKLSESYWIGLVEKEEGQWTWVDGTDYMNGEDCGQLHARVTVDRRRLWNDADCMLSYPYFCEVFIPRDGLGVKNGREFSPK
uniref:Asialoglycoprotein receptor-like 1 n=1 Tax=Sinocyclocheilus rhinocerous TaxID=307959 RepID=A0A673HGP1_9TELE